MLLSAHSNVGSCESNKDGDHEAPVKFPDPYTTTPRVVLGLSTLDLGNKKQVRVKTFHDKADDAGFIAHCKTWNDTKLYNKRVSWLALSEGDHEFQLGEHEQITPATTSETSKRIDFEQPYSLPPKVICFFTWLDLSKDDVWRIKTYVSNVDPSGFTIHVDTWSTSKAYGFKVGWIAWPGDLPFVFGSTFSTEDDKPLGNPLTSASKSIQFGGKKFVSTPTVFMAFNMLDISNKHYMRIKATADKITQNDMTWHVDSWDDSTFYRAGVSFLSIGRAEGENHRDFMIPLGIRRMGY